MKSDAVIAAKIAVTAIPFFKKTPLRLTFGKDCLQVCNWRLITNLDIDFLPLKHRVCFLTEKYRATGFAF